jgi:CRP-like cAMP-binding protein
MRVEVDAGAKVITLDDYGTAIYFIEQGEADVLTEGGEAELERSLRRLGLERAGR